MSIRTRFAPSPTGFLHIGGVRTALFNWLLARQAGGQFILRIDDTDRDRNIDKALQPILDGFRWLGIDWDEGPEVGGPYEPYFQSQRNDRYQAAVDQLLAGGFAYRDYSKSEEFQAEREAAEKEKRNFVYSRSWMAETDQEAAKFESEGRAAVIRLKMPREGVCQFNDLVRGEVAVNWNEEPDHVIQRANGTFIYHLANVVDDEDYKITHVVRAVEHLPNTPRQIFMIQSLAYQMPIYAHVPYVAEPGSQNKLSKRKIAKYMNNRDFKKLYEHGLKIASRIGVEENPESFNPVLVDFYQAVGYLPDAILNYLLLLGWSLDDKTEEFSRQEMIDAFTIDRIVKSPASFDPQKLMAFQDRKMQSLPTKQKVALVIPFLQSAGLIDEPTACEMGPFVTRIVEAAGDRIKVAGDILEFDDFFTGDADLRYDEKAFQKRLAKPAAAVGLLSEFKQVIAAADKFDAGATEKLLHEFVESKGIKIGEIIHALRVSLTGKAAGFGMFDTMEILGRDRCVSRIENTLAKLNS